MTDISVVPQITWADIKPKLPLIQNNEASEPRAQPFFRTFSVVFDDERGEWGIQNSSFGFIGLIPDTYNADIHVIQKNLEDFLYRHYQGLLRAAVGASVYDILLTLAKQVPYTQECTCADADHGLMAADCHVHYDDPVHFVGDYSFPCTCHEQKGAINAAHSS